MDLLRLLFDCLWSSGRLFLDLGPDLELDDRFFEECLRELWSASCPLLGCG